MMDQQTKAKMIQAGNYIKRKDYNRARYILVNIDDEKAIEWLKKLNRIDPSYSESTDYTFSLIYWTGSIIGLIVCLIIFNSPYSIHIAVLVFIMQLLIYSLSMRNIR